MKIVWFLIFAGIILLLGSTDYYVNRTGSEILAQYKAVEKQEELKKLFTPEILADSGIAEVELFNSEIVGEVLGELKFGTDTEVQVVRYTITKDIKTFAEVYEVSNATHSYDLYAKMFLRAQADKPELEINETGSYGLNSFYLNNPQDNSQIRLIVQSENRIWGFKYPQTSHQEMLKLIQVLSNL